MVLTLCVYSSWGYLLLFKDILQNERIISWLFFWCPRVLVYRFVCSGLFREIAGFCYFWDASWPCCWAARHMEHKAINHTHICQVSKLCWSMSNGTPIHAIGVWLTRLAISGRALASMWACERQLRAEETAEQRDARDRYAHRVLAR